MTSDMTVARAYLTPPDASFWQWADAGEAVTWIDGRTITFRGELVGILRRLEPQGLPPLGAVLLLLAATRETWAETSSKPQAAWLMQQLIGGDKAAHPIAVAIGSDGEVLEWLQPVLHSLNAIRSLPAHLREPLRARAELAATVFEDDRPRTSPAAAAVIVRFLEQGLSEEIFTQSEVRRLKRAAAAPRDLRWQIGELRHGLVRMCRGLKKVNADSLALRLQTGLEQLPEPAPIELTSSEQVRALLARLEGDEELGGMARLARNLMAAVCLPRPVADPEDLPLGGVSDISHRGSLDRLLLSELAHDDLTLAVRVAVNEALYLRRESPPRTPPRSRFVLLDSGLRMWGVPRVFAAAVGLALAATTDRHTQTLLYRSQAAAAEKVNLSSPAGLAAHMAALDHHAHPGAALAAFLAATADEDRLADRVIVTGEDVLADRQFERALADSGAELLHIATVNRGGRFRLIARTPRGRRVLREASLSLDEILRPRRPAAALVDPSQLDWLPAIFRVKPFPLHLSAPLNVARSWHVKGHGALSITADGRLLFWQNPGRGARQLAEDLPKGDLHWAADQSGGKTQAIIGRLSSRGLHLLSVDLESCDCRITRLELDEENPKAVAGYKGFIFVIYNRRVAAFESVSGRMTGSLELPGGLVWIRDRFFSRNTYVNGIIEWHALYCDGLAPRLEAVPTEADPKLQMHSLFDVQGLDGPVGVTGQGDLYFTAEKTLKQTVADDPREAKMRKAPAQFGAEMIRVRAVSRDGLRCVVQTLPTTESWPAKLRLIDVLNGTCKTVIGDPVSQVEPEILSLVRPRMLRHHFRSIAAGSEGSLQLESRKGMWWRVVWVPEEQCLRLRHVMDVRTHAHQQKFIAVSDSSSVRNLLWAANWSNGSRALLDARGLLHLKSADAAIPELTLVLTEGQLAGWTSLGGLFGPNYFIGEPTATVSCQAVVETILKPFVAGLPW